MKIKSIKLENFRAFKNAELEFPNSNTIAVIGNNGSGKTTLLDAIAICYTHLTGYLFATNEGYNIDAWFKNDDLSLDTQIGKLTISFDYRLPEINTLFGEDTDTKQIIVTKHRNEPGLNFNHNPPNFHKQIKELIRNKKLTNIPIISYYNVNRTYPSKSIDKKIKTYNDILFAYEKSLSLSSPNFNVFSEWYKNQEILENSLKVNQKDLNYELPSLGIIRKAIYSFMSILHNDYFSDLQIIRESVTSADIQQEVLEYIGISKNKILLKFNQLSSGERMIILLITDIARRLSIANNQSPDALNGTGIVLIDELELHLHPNWQVLILPALVKTFPNIQFIVTSHSPLILSGVRRENIVISMPGQFGDNSELPDIYSDSANEILDKILGADISIEDFDQYKNKLDILFTNLEFEKAKEEVIKLKKIIKSSPKWLKDYEKRIDFALS